MAAGRKAFERASGNEERVEIAVPVIVEQGHAAAQGLDNVVLLIVAAAVEGVRQARFSGNISEFRRGREQAGAE